MPGTTRHKAPQSNYAPAAELVAFPTPKAFLGVLGHFLKISSTVCFVTVGRALQKRLHSPKKLLDNTENSKIRKTENSTDKTEKPKKLFDFSTCQFSHGTFRLFDFSDFSSTLRLFDFSIPSK